ncbi:RUS family member 1 isoform X1 [Microcaecilia unicolor]|uniref:RUS1 family protein C16orf58 homolog isoform X1 n=1 Tax=Microcaecilia unicolor TaxID=1415580 RepID=A0A6P7YST7_9AMPH|nr:RUS1 family protein C16orf58 homolog isoform X1 [Microcaecilia unicolor]
MRRKYIGRCMMQESGSVILLFPGRGGGKMATSMSQLLCSEHYGSSLTRRYIQREDGHLACILEQRKGSCHSLCLLFTSVFLPQGYPESVSEDYLTYQIWDTLQAFASSITGTLATQAILRGVGVGDDSATVTAATITWIMKDGTGMLGRILFAWMKGSKLDCDAKKWRLFADILNDVAIFMEIVAPAFPACFTLIICTAGLFKCIVGVAGGATRAALTMHQARRNNMADVSAKDGSQETLVNLAGLLVSLLLIPLVTDNLRLTYGLYLLFTSLHLYANYRAVRGVVMETLNQARLHILVEHFLREGKVLTPPEANAMEPVLPVFRQSLTVILGAPFLSLASSISDFEKALVNNQKKYLLGYSRTKGKISIVLHPDASSIDMIQACTHAEVFNMLLYGKMLHCQIEASSLRELQKRLQNAPKEGIWEIISETHLLLDRIFPKILKGFVTAGWVTDRNLLNFDEWRVDWNLEAKKMQ